SSDVPVIFLTALSDEDDKLLGYELGADDYITNPFSLSVLYAKTEALIKRNQRRVVFGERMDCGEIVLETSTRRVFAGKNEVMLTPKEFALLKCLMQNKNIVLSREQLLVKCWGYDYEGEDRAVDTHIRRLREKLGKYSDCIKTVIKAGYKMEG
ncbi:MAG: response regulator transcription factor, partial [Clostridia bacterium]|nr:response regulator transcription factor [Clostridia bacterium]